MSTSYKQHEEASRNAGPVRVGVITVSDTRTEETDRSGALIKDLLQQAGHTVVAYRIVRDERQPIQEAIRSFAANPDLQVIICNGGTGINPRDVTVEAIGDLLEKRLDGFGELFRMLSYEEIGSAAIMSRALAGTLAGRVVFATPGSTNAVRLAMEKLILPQLDHLVWELQR